MAMWVAGGPEPRYAQSEDGYVAYQVFGDGPRDLLLIGNWASNIEVMWEHPSMARYLERLGRFARVICFDKRGAGISDPVSMGALPTLEQWVDDARAVLDAVGFAAALAHRGIRLVRLPTTTLAQADSGVGVRLCRNPRRIPSSTSTAFCAATP